MIIRIINRKNPDLYEDYDNVIKVTDKKDKDGNIYHIFHLEDKTTETYKSSDWAFFTLEWNPLFPTF